MKKLFKAVSVLLVFAMLFSFAACTGSNDTEETGTGDQTNTDTPVSDPNKYADIAGEYMLDATDLGMAMKWYIKISADGKFVISTARDYTAVKGEGTVGDKDGTYMLVYSDSTNEEQKTATFKFEGKNMVFSTSVPIGAASVSPSEDGKYPTAKPIAHEELLGTYYGELNKTTAMGAVAYTYELTLKVGLEYEFVSSFEMMGSPYSRTETGSFDIKDGKISFSAKDVDGKAVETVETVEGTIADKTVKAAFKLSTMAKTADEIEAKFGTHSEWAGTYTAYYEKAMGQMPLKYVATLALDAFGGYKYTTANPDKADDTTGYSEEGTYTVDGGKFSFKSNKEGAVAVEGTLANYVLKTKLPVTTMVPNAAELDFYTEAVSGDFYARTADGDKAYAGALSLVGNQFGLGIGPMDAENNYKVNYFIEGKFEIKAGMMTQITFTTEKAYTDETMTTELPAIPDELKSFTLPVADSGINGEFIFDLNDTKTLVFQFTHDISVLQG